MHSGSLLLGGLIGYIAVVIRQEFVVLVMCGLFLLMVVSIAPLSHALLAGVIARRNGA